MSGAVGRRDLRKQETRAALHHAALEIAAAEGVARATVERIVERAQVSPRTFFNYFPTKEAAISGVDPELPAALAAALRARPTGEPLRKSLREILEAHLGAAIPDPETWRLRALVAQQLPSSLTTAIGNEAAAAQALATVAYERAGADPHHDIDPAAAVFAALAAVRTAIWLYGQRGCQGEIPDIVGECFDRAFDA
jgi:AcrR family transcriptional regulator